MRQDEIIKQAVKFQIQNNKILISSSIDEINLVELWFQNNESDLKELLNALSYNKANFIAWWNGIYSKYSSKEYIKNIFSMKPDAKNTLLWFGQNSIKKIVGKTASTGFTDPETWKKIDLSLWLLCYALSLTEIKKPIKTDKFDRKDFEKLFKIDPDDLLPKNVSIGDDKVPYWSNAESSTRPSRSRKEDSAIWSEIPPTLAQPFIVKTSTEAVNSYNFLSNQFDRFIVETYYDYKDQRTKELGDYRFPHVRKIALRNLIGVFETDKFNLKNIAESRFRPESDQFKQPASFNLFWQNLPKKYAKSQRIQQILNTEIDICPPEEKTTKALPAAKEYKELQAAFINVIKQWIDNVGVNEACYSTFVDKTNYNQSQNIEQFKDWWKQTIFRQIYDYNTKAQEILKKEIDFGKGYKKTLNQLAFIDVSKDDRYEITFFIPEFIYFNLDQNLKDFIKIYCDEQPAALPPKVSTWSSNLKIAKISDTYFENTKYINNNKYQKFSQEKKTEDNCKVKFYTLGFEGTSKLVDDKLFYKLTQELFTLIRINEFSRLTNKAIWGRNIADFIGSIDTAADISTGLASAFLSPSKRRER